MSERQPPGPADRAAPARASTRKGRPPRIDRAAIAAAAGALPLTDLTMRSVAERLGVTVSSLYHYVAGRDDLFALAAEQTAHRLTLPADHGQHWAVWFHEWATYIQRAFVADPGLLKQYIDGAISVEAMADNIDAALDLCVRQGFTPAEALHAYDLVSECALGAAVARIRADAAASAGRDLTRDVRRLIADGRPLPHLSALASTGALDAPPPFHDHITTVLLGLALRRGEDPAETVALLEAQRPVA
ncbi:TetR/AcrR family transcriptional regulator [Actinocorallia herbida]|uniref:TetR/AcrR family transcriptional regulator n=1 Tax=Actinocorallia herbida TaxID=58109 RepID=UPI000F4B2ECD|nr:TetR/AcrR family transcriptional regulator C-terminal domain-containing protein [Actinocorallia herbida]